MGYVARPVELISNYSTGCQCDDGLDRDLERQSSLYFKSVSYIVMYKSLIANKFEGEIFLVGIRSLPMKI